MNLNAILWNKLEEKVFSKKHPSNAEFIELYNIVHDYCIQSQEPLQTVLMRAPAKRTFATYSSVESTSSDKIIGRDLYLQLVQFLKRHLYKLLRQIHLVSYDRDVFRNFTTHWKRYQSSCRVLDGIFMYLNRNWVKNECIVTQKKVHEVYELGLVLWRDIIFVPLQEKITKTLLDLIEEERNVDMINSTLIGDAIKCYVDLGISKDFRFNEPNLNVYRNAFEAEFLQKTELFYKLKSETFLVLHSVPKYMKLVELKINEESCRVTLYLHKETFPRLMQICVKVLIQDHIDKFYHEFSNLLASADNAAKEHLGRMYRLVLHYPPGMTELANRLENHIYAHGLAAIEQCKKLKNYVPTILQVHSKYSSLIRYTFANDIGFVRAFNNACSRFINHNAVTKVAVSKSPELLAKFCDALLKKSSNVRQENEKEKALNQVMIVFKYLENEDAFEEFYRKFLASRLVLHLSESEEAEISMIFKLKNFSGSVFTSKLEQMFQDFKVGYSFNADFKKLTPEFGGVSFDFNVQVLKPNLWPFKQLFKLDLPLELERPINNFTTFYQSQHAKRTLQWMHSMSSGEIVASCFKNRYTFQVSTYQMAVLLQYNTTDSLTIAQLYDVTHIEMKTLVQVLLILLKAKLLVLSQNESSVNNHENENNTLATYKDINGSEHTLYKDSTFSLYFGYNNRKLCVNLNVPIKYEVKQSQEMTTQNIEKNRVNLIQATIVCIMKRKKVLAEQALLTEVISQLSERFKPNVNLIKKCFGQLVDREFLKISESLKDTYEFVA